MIRRLYIDGYKAFVNHTIEFDRLVFLAGGNGTGKSSHFDVLSAVRRLVYEGKLVSECFPESCFSQFSWQTDPKITIEIDATLSAGPYRYRLVVVRSVLGIVIAEESLSLKEDEFYRFSEGIVRFDTLGRSSTEVPLAANRSGLPMFSMGHGPSAGSFFLSELAHLQIVRLNPFDMNDGTLPAAFFMVPSGKNFVSWLSHEMADFTKAQKIVARWQEALGVPLNPSFDSADSGGKFKLELRYGMSSQSSRLSDLSEGQRCLLVIHALLATVQSRGGVLMLDEPDNFLSIREVQALSGHLQEVAEHEGTQIIVASHNPGLVRSLGGLYGYRFYRDPSGHVRYTDLAEESDGVSADLIVQLEEAA